MIRLVPLALFLPLLSENGMVMLATAAFCGLVLLVAVPSLIIRFSLGEKSSVQFKSAVMTSVVALAVIGYSTWSIAAAKAEALDITNQFQELCKNVGTCEMSPIGWESAKFGDFKHRKLCGWYAKFPIYYKSNGTSFTLYLKIGPDMEEEFHGGVG